MSSSRAPRVGEFVGPAPTRNGTLRLRLHDYAALIKLRLSAMVLFSGIVGFVLAAPALPVTGDALYRLMAFALGTLFVIGAANAFNQVLERDQDAQMRRTKNRPLPSGRLSVAGAILFASVLCVSGCAVLVVGTNVATAATGLFAVVVYVAVYTPLKDVSPWSTAAGAVAGALPPLMGGLAASGQLPLLVWCTFGIVFLWQFPHTWAITVLHREDYQSLGYRMLPLLAGGDKKTRTRVFAYSLLLVSVSLVPVAFGLVGGLYAFGAVVLGGLMIWASIRFGTHQERPYALQLMFATLVYLPVLLSLLALQRSVL